MPNNLWPERNKHAQSVFPDGLMAEAKTCQALQLLRRSSANLFVGTDPRYSSLQNWLAAAFYACAAYDARRHYRCLRDWLGVNLITWEAESAEGFVADLPSCTVVAIAGSNDSGDWQANRRFLSTDILLPGAKRSVPVHRGFARQYLAVGETLQPIIKLRGKPTLYVGHSLGAAIAQLLTVCRPDDLPPASAIIFASPRVGGAHFALFAGLELITHLWNVGDFVPHLPPWLFGYRHPQGQAVFVGRKGELRSSRSAVLTDSLVASLRTIGLWPRPSLRYCVGALEAHGIDESITRLALAYLNQRSESL